MLSASVTNTFQGFHLNYGTWQSAIHGFACANELKPLRKKLFPQRLPVMEPKLKSRFAAQIWKNI